MLLFVVLLYVYPLKLLAELASERVLGVGRARVAAGLTYLGIGGVAGLSIVAAALGLGLGWGLPVWLLLVLSLTLGLVRLRASRRAGGCGPAPRRARLLSDRDGGAGR